MELLKPGETGARVVDVQMRLAALGSPIPPEERGTFGERTETAVRAFQTLRGLAVDGIVGPDTWRALVESAWALGDRVLYLRTPNLRGDDVRDLQDRLMTLGFDAWRVDGIFGERTLRAVREFQRNVGIQADGLVAEETVRALKGLQRMTGDTPAALVREREAMRTRPGSIARLRIALDPGHGGGDDGHVSARGMREADLCFHVARRVEAALASEGAQVYMTRPATAAPDDSARAMLANVVDADVYLAIHASGDPEPGCRTSYFGHERYHSETGRHLAELLQQELSKLDFGDRGAHPKMFTVLRETRMTAVFCELGSLSVEHDAARLAEHDTQERIATAITEAVRRFALEPVTV